MFMEVNSVRSGTAGAHEKSVKGFDHWKTAAGICAVSAADPDAAGHECLEHLYFEGYNHDAGVRLLASLRCCPLLLATSGEATLPRSQCSQRGFGRIAPGANRAPLPLIAVVAMIAAAFHLKELVLGVALLVQQRLAGLTRC